MSDKVIRLPSGHFRIARVAYFSDLRRSDSPVIPIGVVAEVVMRGVRAIGAALRPSLTEAELKSMGPWMRESLANPMDFLWPKLREALDSTAPGDALEVFSSSYASSLSVLAPQPLDVPKQWLLAKDVGQLEELIRKRLPVTLTEQYFDFLFPPRDNGEVVEPRVEEAVRKAA